MSAIYRTLTTGDSSKNAKSKENSKTKKDIGFANGKKSMNRQRTLLISSRGITQRQRHLMQDLHSLLPHSRKEPKLDSKKKLNNLNEIAELYNCNNILYFESRKHQDLYLWLSKPPNGPTVKFYLQNLHNLDELNFTGNCLKGSRPILSFDSKFDEMDHYKLVKELFIHNFGVPPGHRKSKPFIDHVMNFSIVDGKIWVRNYEISYATSNKDKYEEGVSAEDDISLVEIGPRFVMTIILILEGSFGGPKIYENKQYVSPNVLRAQLKKQLAEEARNRSESAIKRKLTKVENVLKTNPLSNEAVFKD
ncbi:probable Ribosome biogenesis protein BRX1 [Saccharomycodes ludwigii]|uniref:Probable Ribosome biogenesis protein BRX1 n=1 Tax=Saccharomycodes ludwigii TaxID=36035 RepID=A0A376B7Y7_9ASCO|nr:hypothetical protein SCDLUD_002561 [Saccharomycodes ludwigii]KAH3901086.1 hypothetical protein SCDLUD_002561 [Saccharomycodes ludwigii]SSD60679.1 probable Ribosome biogenesis protein BRX1 [Saccharomycodes ludwigii]